MALNPLSLAPNVNQYEPDFLSGYLRAGQRNQYNAMMQQQMSLEDLAMQDSQMNLEKKRKDIPLQDVQRAFEMADKNANMPYLPRLAEERYQRDALGNTQTRGAIARQEFDLKKAGREEEDSAITRSRGALKSLLEQALALGPQAGMEYLGKTLPQYGKAGYHMPPLELLQDPGKWKGLYNGLVNSIEQKQKESLARVGDEGQIKSAQIHANATLEAARIRERAADARRSQDKQEALKNSNMVPQAYRIMADPKATDEQIDLATQILDGYEGDKIEKGVNEVLKNSPQVMRMSPEEVFTLRQNMIDSKMNEARARRRPTGPRASRPGEVSGQVRSGSAKPQTADEIAKMYLK